MASHRINIESLEKDGTGLAHVGGDGKMSSTSNRRDFLKTTCAVASGVVAGQPLEARSQLVASPEGQSVLAMSATELVKEVRERRISPSELVDVALKHIDSTHGDINAIVYRNPSIRNEARKIEEQIANGSVDWQRKPLAGVPISVKDSIDVKGMPTVCGVPKFKDNIASEDATVVRKLRDAGALILGKTNLPALLSAYETHNELFGRTNNPYDANHTSGGSSGGEAAMVASGGSWLGVGSDGLGSIRVPGHCCGVPSLRPGWGRVSRGGHFPPPQMGEGWLPDPSYLCVGPFAKSVDDLYMALTVMQGPDPRDPNCFPVPQVKYHEQLQRIEHLKVVIWSESKGTELTTDTKAVLSKATNVLTESGIAVEPAAPPFADDVYDISQALYSPFFLENWVDVLREHGVESPCPVDIDMIDGLADWHKSYGKDDVETFQQLLPKLRTGFLSFMQKYDIMISSVTATPAPLHATTFDDIRRLVFVQLPSYVPAIPSGSVPCGFSQRNGENHLPIGIMVTGRQFREDTVLAVMKILERELNGWVPPWQA